MQLALMPGTTGPVLLNADQPTVFVPITQRFRSLGVTTIGGLVELLDGVALSNVEVKLCYREFSTDDSLSAGAWTAVGPAATSWSRKVAAQTTVSPTGLFMQLGLELTSTGGVPPTRHVMASLAYPMAGT